MDVLTMLILEMSLVLCYSLWFIAYSFVVVGIKKQVQILGWIEKVSNISTSILGLSSKDIKYIKNLKLNYKQEPISLF